MQVLNFFQLKKDLKLESGGTLQRPKLAYHTFGKKRKDDSNVVWVFHALTANSNPTEWWPGLIGENDFISPQKNYIVCVNMLTSCYGSTEPTSFDFPQVSIRDMVHAYQELAEHLSIKKVNLGIGGSMGGQQLLQWAVLEPEFFEQIVPLATNAVHSPWGIAFNEAQRMALQHQDPEKGMATSRAIGMLSYRHYETFEQSQKDSDARLKDFSAASYQRYQGQKLANRFTATSYFFLSLAMDSHHLGRHFDSMEAALGRISAKTIVIGFATDLLFPPQEQQFLADHIPNSSLHILNSAYGHDGFLIETEQIVSILKHKITL